jgi:hypothetical protein
MRVLETLNSAIALPKLHVNTVDELLGILLRAFVIRPQKLDCPEKLAARRDDVHSILGHL